MPDFRYPVYRPSLSGNEKRYVNECLDSTWISSKGAFVTRFEANFAAYVGASSATSCSNGTVSLHLALLALGIGEGDEVIVPTFTHVASVNAIRYVGATPVFVDSNLWDWQLNLEQVQQAITRRTKAVMAVHIYGQACPLQELANLCKNNGLYLVEDCAEAIGTRVGKTHVGVFGDVGSFSFFGNKTVTTGEGGMLVSNSRELISRCAHLKSQAVCSERMYWHDAIGYNYRMTNICAAIGTAQLERVESIVAKKRALALKYRQELAGLPELTFHDEQPGTTHSFWMVSVRVNDENRRDALRQYLAQHGIETRPGFPPSHLLPMHSTFAAGRSFPQAELLGSTVVNLPSYPDLSLTDVVEICVAIRKFYGVS